MSLIEKGLIKLYGDIYAELRSNPAIESYHICGWIPECVNLADIPNKSNLWERLMQNQDEGNIVLALGTDSKSKKGISLAKEHAYSVLAIKEIESH